MVRKGKKASPSHGRPSEIKNGQNGSYRPNNGGRRRKSKSSKRGKMRRPLTMSDPGRAFLKCAFAPPDFNVDPGKGIPDTYNGKTLARKDVLTQSLNGTAARDDYYIIAPTPGIAYWYAQTATGVPPTSATVWSPQPFPGAFGTASLFGDQAAGAADRATNVDAFRYASLCAGLYPTSNLMTFGGSVQVWKGPIKQSLENVALTFATTPVVSLSTTEVVVTGMEIANSVPTENYSHSFMDGFYTVAGNNQPDFPFNNILEGYNKLPAQATGTSMFGVLNGPFLGMGDTDSIVVKIANGPSTTNSFVLKVWSCQEYRVNPNSTLYQYANVSPNYDPIAMDIYRRTMQQIPLAVVCAENAKFWETVLRIIRGIAGAAAFVPGPIGAIGTGVGMVTDAVSALTL